MQDTDKILKDMQKGEMKETEAILLAVEKVSMGSYIAAGIKNKLLKSYCQTI